MMRKLLFMLFTFVGIVLAAQPDDSSGEVVFNLVNVIAMDADRVVERQTVIVKGGRITYVGDPSKAKYSGNAFIVDGTGKYILPGLAEMHAHVPSTQSLEDMKPVLNLFLYNGVTTIRGMLGQPIHLTLRDKINAGDILGPHFYTTGPSFNGNSVKTVEHGIEMVKEQKKAGYDYLKLHPGLNKEKFAAIAKTAKEVGIPFAGHVSFGVGVERAIEAGYSSIDHLDGFVEFLVPGIDTLAEQEAGPFAAWIAWRADESKIQELAQSLAAKRIWVVPTQSLAERWFSPGAPDEYLNAPEMVYQFSPPPQSWADAKKNYQSNPEFSKEHAQALIDIRRKLILACQKNGVGMLLGSDAPQVMNVPGFSIHHELRYLVDAGLTPFEALCTGTINVATYLGKKDSGLIKKGYVSDFVLLNGNPLKDINQSKNIAGVMLGTKWLPERFILSEMLRMDTKRK